MILLRIDKDGDMLRSRPKVSESVLILFFLSVMLVLLCTRRWSGTSSSCIELRFEGVAEPGSMGELTSLL